MKLNYKRTVLIGMAFLAIAAFWQMYDQVTPLMLKNTFGLGDTLTGTLMAADNVLALFLLPFFGALSDRSSARLGRRTPFILAGTAVAVIMMALLPLADNAANLPLFLAVLFVLLMGMCVYRSPAVALMPDVTPKPLRSKGNAIINLMGALGGMIALVLISLLVKSGGGQRDNYQALFLAVGALMAVSAAVVALTIRERKLAVDEGPVSGKPEDAPEDRLPPEMRRSLLLILASVFLWFMGYNAVTSAFSRYAQEVWGMDVGQSSINMLIANAGAIVFFIPVGILASRYGRKRLIQVGVALLASCFAAVVAFGKFGPLIYPLFALVGCAWACINVNSYPMVVELSRSANVGKYTGYYYTFSMAAQIATPMLSGFLLEHVGYWSLFPYAALMVAASFVTISLTRHGDNRPDAPKDKIEAFDVEG